MGQTSILPATIPTGVGGWGSVGQFDSLAFMELSANSLFPVAAEPYQQEAFGPLLTALAAEDAWNGGDLGFSSTVRNGLSAALVQQYGNNPPVNLAEQRLAPVSAFTML